MIIITKGELLSLAQALYYLCPEAPASADSRSSKLLLGGDYLGTEIGPRPSATGSGGVYSLSLYETMEDDYSRCFRGHFEPDGALRSVVCSLRQSGGRPAVRV